MSHPRRYTPFVGHNKLVRGGSSLSNSITVIGRNDLSATEPQSDLPSLLTPKVRRLTKSKLASLQQRDNAARMLLKSKETAISRSDQNDLDSLRDAVSGGVSIGPETFDERSNSDWMDVDESNASNSDSEGELESEAAIVKGLGLPESSTEWSRRLSREDDAWRRQLPALYEAYLDFDSGTLSHPVPNETEEVQYISLQCISMKEERIQSFPLRGSQDWPNAALIRHGFLSPSPMRPTVAISLELLEVFAAFQSNAPSLSIQAMAKSSCDLRNVPYQSHFRTQLTSALDIYLQIRRKVNYHVDSALGRSGTDWRLKNCCPPCMRKVKGEPRLQRSILVTFDGNDSLKRYSQAGVADNRTFESDYYINSSEVDRFQDEVANSRSTRKRSKNQQDLSNKSECEKRWKNASADARPSSDRGQKFFDETGVFVAMCRHSFVLTVCDMVKSGERAKYGLATINKLISAFGSDILVGYDIGCSFKGTVARSALLGPRAKESNFDMCVGSFHGPAHNRACQVENHPHHRLGAGLTDFENCETLFSSSNRIASATRLASTFHRHQRIDTFLRNWDNDAYRNLGSLTRRKYNNALDVVETSLRFLAKFPLVSNTDIQRFFQEEKDYLQSFRHEPPDDTFAINYVELLEQLAAKNLEFERWQDTPSAIGTKEPQDLRQALLQSQIETKRRAALEQLLALQSAVEKLEAEHKIEPRWTSDMPAWQEAQMLRHNKHFYACLDDLERLIVQRMLEISRAGLAGTGYNMRAHIMKSLAARSGALKAALTRYNKAALILNPPAPQLTWEQVVNASVLSDLPILRGSRRHILEKTWTKPENRQCLNQYHRLLRAREEIERLNIELQRLHASILDESVTLPALLSRVQTESPRLSRATQRLVEHRLAVNKILARELRLISALPGYSGDSSIGIHKEMTQPGSMEIDISQSADSIVSEASHGNGGSASDGYTPVDLQHEHDEHLDVGDEVADRFDRWQDALERVADSH